LYFSIFSFFFFEKQSKAKLKENKQKHVKHGLLPRNPKNTGNGARFKT